MKPTNVTVERFVEENLPDYEERLAEWKKENGHLTGRDYLIDKRSWYDWVFPEALAAYTDRICHEQREICWNKVVEKCNLGDGWNSFISAIENAPAPEITKTNQEATKAEES